MTALDTLLQNRRLSLTAAKVSGLSPPHPTMLLHLPPGAAQGEDGAPH